MQSAVNREHPSKDGHETLDFNPNAAIEPRVDHLACAILAPHEVAFDCMCPYIIKDFPISLGISRSIYKSLELVEIKLTLTKKISVYFHSLGPYFRCLQYPIIIRVWYGFRP